MPIPATAPATAASRMFADSGASAFTETMRPSFSNEHALSVPGRPIIMGCFGRSFGVAGGPARFR